MKSSNSKLPWSPGAQRLYFIRWWCLFFHAKLVIILLISFTVESLTKRDKAESFHAVYVPRCDVRTHALLRLVGLNTETSLLQLLDVF